MDVVDSMVYAEGLRHQLITPEHGVVPVIVDLDHGTPWWHLGMPCDAIVDPGGPRAITVPELLAAADDDPNHPMLCTKCGPVRTVQEPDLTPERLTALTWLRSARELCEPEPTLTPAQVKNLGTDHFFKASMLLVFAPAFTQMGDGYGDAVRHFLPQITAIFDRSQQLTTAMNLHGAPATESVWVTLTPEERPAFTYKAMSAMLAQLFIETPADKLAELAFAHPRDPATLVVRTTVGISLTSTLGVHSPVVLTNGGAPADDVRTALALHPADTDESRWPDLIAAVTAARM